MVPARPAERARRFLELRLSRMAERRENRLPSLGVLAAQAGVSRGVMARVVSVLKAQGAVQTRPGSGMWRAGADLPEPRVPAGVLKWQRTRDAVLEDIQKGTYARGKRLPGSKELCARYNVVNRTLNKALQALGVAGLVHQERGHWCAGGRPRWHRTNALLLCAVGDWYGNLEEPTAQVRRNVEELVRLCAAENIELVSCMCRRHPGAKLAFDDSAAELVDTLARQGRLMGSVVFTLNLPRGPLVVLRSILSRHPLPVAFFNEAGDWDEHKVAGAPCLNVKYDNVAAGRHVGQFLLDRGYREAAWLAHDLEPRYCRDRLTGLQEAFAGAGLDGAVHVYTGSSMSQHHTDSTGLNGFTVAERVFREARTDYLPSPQRAASIRGLLKQQVDKLQQLIATHEENKAVIQQMAREVAHMPWVGVRDALALECLEMGPQTGKKGDRPAVIGFDDTAEAARCSLTSYNFGGNEAMRAVFSHCLQPLPSAGARGLVQVLGYVVPRGSVPYARREQLSR